MRREKNIINYLTTQYFSTSTMVFALSKCVSVQKKKVSDVADRTRTCAPVRQ